MFKSSHTTHNLDWIEALTIVHIDGDRQEVLPCFKPSSLICLPCPPTPSMHTQPSPPRAHLGSDVSCSLHPTDHPTPITGAPTSLRAFLGAIEHRQDEAAVISLVLGCRRGRLGRLLQGKPGVSTAIPAISSTLVKTTTASSSRVSYFVHGLARQLPPSRHPFPHGREQQAAAVPLQQDAQATGGA
jgi:hypothetical protein